ncbi:MAG: hypothetical protein A2Z57_11125 [Planctomycetes bacterium RIFCSPHIGHO2_12_39_6]|nr:MAG: hypothetical protein A2Z57_11125 [Planctomycetes bacterium RIFCSPHIGHO2_12_39_6]
MSLEKAIKEDLPELLKFLKAKFSTSKTFKSDNGELIHDGELVVGSDVFLMEADKKVPAPEKTYKHEDGTEVTVKEGKVIDIKAASAKTEMNAKEIAEEIFKTFPKTDLSAIEVALGELKTTLAEISKQKNELKAKVDKFEGFKDEVIGILDKFSKTASVTPAAPKKTDSSKSIFNSEMSFDERVKRLQTLQS